MTIKDVAKEAAVSTATVSYVINGTRPVMPKTRQRVLDAINRTNYQPNRVAKSLRTKKTGIIGVLAEDIIGFPTAGIINGITEYVEQTDYHILLNDLRMLDSLYNKYDQIVKQKDKINEALSLLIYGAHVDAVIYVGMFDRDISGMITNINKPFIFAYSTTSDDGAYSVSYDNENISAELVRHLIENGHRQFAVITGPTHTSPTQMRLRGIINAFEEAGLAPGSIPVKGGDWSRASGYECMKEILRENATAMPSAILAMNDYMAVGAMDAIGEAGISIPGDISIVGFDNREISEFVSPRLTTAEIDLRNIGFTAAKMAHQKLNGTENADVSNMLIPCRLIKRDTVTNIKETEKHV